MEDVRTFDRKEEEYLAQEQTTRLGNPRKPQGDEGEAMLRRMNKSHFELTGWAINFFNFQEHDTILDIGCGGGETLRRLSEKVPSGHLTGVDYSELSVKLSREWNAEAISNGKMDILEASVEKLPFEDESFDKIITVESFYFWPNPEENLREVLRVLKKGGVFLLVAEIYGKEQLTEEVQKSIQRYELRNPTREEFSELFRQAGYSVVEIHTKNGADWICVQGIR